MITEFTDLIDNDYQTRELIEERGRVEQDLGNLAERLETLIRENARVAQDQTAYLKQENEIRARYLDKQQDLEQLDEQIAERENKRNTLESMIQVVCGIDGEQVAFDEELWGGLLDHIVVKEGGAVVVVFKGGLRLVWKGSHPIQMIKNYREIFIKLCYNLNNKFNMPYCSPYQGVQ